MCGTGQNVTFSHRYYPCRPPPARPLLPKPCCLHSTPTLSSTYSPWEAEDYCQKCFTVITLLILGFLSVLPGIFMLSLGWIITYKIEFYSLVLVNTEAIWQLKEEKSFVICRIILFHSLSLSLFSCLYHSSLNWFSDFLPSKGNRVFQPWHKASSFPLLCLILLSSWLRKLEASP